jgi:thioredoxin-like negative regulator of GroEL
MWEKEVLHADHPVMVALYNPTDMSGTEKVGIIDRFVQNRDNLSLIKVDATRNELVKKRYRIDYDQLPQVYVFERGEVKGIIKNISQEQLEKFVQ